MLCIGPKILHISQFALHLSDSYFQILCIGCYVLRIECYVWGFTGPKPPAGRPCIKACCPAWLNLLSFCCRNHTSIPDWGSPHSWSHALIVSLCTDGVKDSAVNSLRKDTQCTDNLDVRTTLLVSSHCIPTAVVPLSVDNSI